MNRETERYSSPRLSDEEMDAKIAWLNDHDAFEPRDPKAPGFVDAITDEADNR